MSEPTIALLKRERKTRLKEIQDLITEVENVAPSREAAREYQENLQRLKGSLSDIQEKTCSKMHEENQKSDELVKEYEKTLLEIDSVMQSLMIVSTHEQDSLTTGLDGISSPRESTSLDDIERKKSALEEQLRELHDECDRMRRQRKEEERTLLAQPSNRHSSRHQDEDTEVQLVTSLLEKLVKSTDLPKPELTSFSGKPTDYAKFINSFELNVESCTKDNRLRLNYLIQFCEGKAKSCIEAFMLMRPEEGYPAAKNALKERYGSPHVIARHYIDMLVNGACIKAGDVRALENLATEMQTCELTLSNLQYSDTLNSLDTLRKIVSRIPHYLKIRWADLAADIVEKSGREPNYSELLKFVKRQLKTNATAFGVDLNYENRSQANVKSSQKYPTSKQKLFNLQASKKCPVCPNQCSHLPDCDKFKSLSLEQRLKIVSDNRLCFKCLKAGHSARVCYSKRNCSACNKGHNTLLHKFTPVSVGTNLNCKNASFHKKVQCCLNIVPVTVLAKGGKPVNTYALLDSGSDLSLCTQGLLDKLGVKGTPKSYSITTINRVNSVQRGSEVYLNVKPYMGGPVMNISRLWSVPSLPVDLSGLADEKVTRTWPHLKDIPLPKIKNASVTLLLGADNSHITSPIDSRVGGKNQPTAVKSSLGWSVCGYCYEFGKNPKISRKTGSVRFQQQVCNDVLMNNVNKMWSTEFSDILSQPEVEQMSVEDKQALKVMNESIQFKEGHYHVKLPWRREDEELENNYSLAKYRLQSLSKRLSKEPNLLKVYNENIENWVKLDQARVMKPDELQDKVSKKQYFLPHHPVINEKKPGKLRVVFDCAAKFAGKSLNSALLQGPVHMNTLVGVLSRFREYPVALAADIQSMFHQVRVYEDDEKSLKFLWYPNGNLLSEPKVYCMRVHLFGATSSPSVTSFALRRAAMDQSEVYKDKVVKTVMSNFYVDDCLTSTENVLEAKELSSSLIEMLANKGFKLTKWVSSHKEVVSSIPVELRSPNVSCLDLSCDNLPQDRALGISWDIQQDVFVFSVKLPERPETRRGILSIIASIFDPLGLVVPVTLESKMLLQKLCSQKLDWDDKISQQDSTTWKRCLTELKKLQGMKIRRCFRPLDFGIPVKFELHCFSDASLRGFGAVAYIRMTNVKGQVSCSLVLGKSRLAPLKCQSIPRLELSAAVVACRLGAMVQNELECKFESVMYWTDSTVVLGYLNNQSTRYKTFVANRVSSIHELSTVSQWRHVPSKLNPADLASRGISASDSSSLKFWAQGPEFLYSNPSEWPKNVNVNEISVNTSDVEMRKQTYCTTVKTNALGDLMSKYSSFHKLKRVVAWFLRYKAYCRNKYLNHELEILKGELCVNELKEAEVSIVKYVQGQVYADEISQLKRGSVVKKDSMLYKLNPFLEDEIIRVGGRIKNSSLCYQAKHQIVIPKQHRIARSIILDVHKEIGHMGTQCVLHQVRKKYWIVHGTSLVKSVLNECIPCKRRKAKSCSQQMADLPAERLTENKCPFAATGIDYFGPVMVKVGRSLSKRYGVIFTCLAIRAVHLEVAHSLDTDSFLLAFSRFCSRRGCPEKVFSDNGTNLTKGHKELQTLLIELDQSKISKSLVKQGIQWHFNTPYGSHEGGVYERMIRSVRNVLSALTKQQVLSCESLSSLMCMAENILNQRPICQVSNDPSDLGALSPNLLLLFEHDTRLPVGNFEPTLVYSMRRWNQVRYLTHVFWKRWSKEYLSTLQSRQRWQGPRPNLKVNDLVLLVESNVPRNGWSLGRVIEAKVGRDDLVRSCSIKRPNGTIVHRPISKLCLLEASS